MIGRLPPILLTLALLAAASSCRTAPVVSPAEVRAKAHVDQAQQYLKEGLTDSALASFGLALEENPKLVDAHVGMGHIYRERGDYALARRSYENAADIDANHFEANYHLALMHQLLGNLPDAVGTYLRALTINPDDFKANQNLAAAYLQMGKPAAALPYARRATELNPDEQSAWANLATAYRLVGNHAMAVRAYREAAELGEVGEPILIGLASSHVRLGNHQRAINVLQALIRREPSAVAYERLGYAQFRQRRFDDALASFRAALSLDPDDTAALNGLGVCLMTLYLQGERQTRSQHEQAIEAWRRSLVIRPEQSRIIDLIHRYQRY
jgi:tetratricopeptide (TPR) repeat protein